MTAEMMELVGAIVGAVLTVLVLSYLILGDWPLYRLALHILVGATIGYAVAIVSYTVFVQMLLPILVVGTSDRWMRFAIVFPLILGLLLLFKGFSRSRLVVLGNPSTAFLVGVGTAVAVGGALVGTILPQGVAFGGGLGIRLLIALGTICTLLTFTLTFRQQQTVQGLGSRILNLLGGIGRFFLLFALGAAFATALTASLSILIGRIYTIIQFILQSVLPQLPGG